jgi:hypothetical protein
MASIKEMIPDRFLLAYSPTLVQATIIRTLGSGAQISHLRHVRDTM